MADGAAVFKNKEIVAFLTRLEKKQGKISKKDKGFWGILQARAFADVIDHFEKEMGPKGKWDAWSRAYAQRMARIGKGGNKILQDNGKLRQFLLIAKTSSRIKQGQLLFNPAKTKKGFPYAQLHDEGGKFHPQREFMWLSNKAQKKMVEDVLEYQLEDKD